MEAFITAQQRQMKLKELLIEREKENCKWIEINFKEIQTELSPFRYCPFGIWYKATWNYAKVIVCVGIGGVQPELLYKFRKYSSKIQYFPLFLSLFKNSNCIFAWRGK